MRLELEDTAALLVVGALDGNEPQQSSDGAGPRIRALVEGMRRGGRYVVVHDGGGGSAFVDSFLNHRLLMLGVHQLIVAGAKTTGAVASTVEDAYRLGYDVVVIRDAVHDSDLDGHEFALAWAFPSHGEVCLTEDVLRLTRESRSTSWGDDRGGV